MKNVTFAVTKYYFYSPFLFFLLCLYSGVILKIFSRLFLLTEIFYVLIQIIFNKNNQFIVVVLCSCHKLVTWAYGQNANASAYRFRNKNGRTERQKHTLIPYQKYRSEVSMHDWICL